MKEQRARNPTHWPHHSLHKAAAQTLEASDLLAMSADRLIASSLTESAGRRGRSTTVRTHHALQQTRHMLEQAAQAMQRAKVTFAPLGLTRSPF